MVGVTLATGVVVTSIPSDSAPGPKQNLAVNALRWLLVLPASVAAMWAVPKLVGVFLWLNTSVANGPTWLDLIMANVFGAIAFGAAFVYAGARTAPTGQGVVAIILATILILLSVFLIVGYCVDHEWWNLVQGVIASISAAVAATAVHQESGRGPH